jgi:CrcB protein
VPPADLTLRAALLVASGAVGGALARWAMGVLLSRAFPWGTIVVNATGCFLLGLFVYGGFVHGWMGDDARLLVAVGALGAFTTMSAFAVETVEFLEEGAWRQVALVVLLNPVLGVGAAWLGRTVGLALPWARA